MLSFKPNVGKTAFMKARVMKKWAAISKVFTIKIRKFVRIYLWLYKLNTNAGRTGLRFNKPDWDRNYSWLPEPKRLINGIFMKGASKMNI